MKQYALKHAGTFSVFLLSFVTPIVPMLVLTGVLIFCDAVTGVWRAVKTNQKITSKKLGGTVNKFVLYSLAILLTHGVETVFTALQFIHMTQIAAGFICMVELKSVYENISDITGLNIWKYLSSRVDALRGIEH